MKDSSSPVRYDVFLSDDSADKDAVAQIAARLRDDGVSPFLDKWCLVPGARWQERLREALLASQCAAVFFGTGGGGRWRDEELIATVAPLDAERFERETRDLSPQGGSAHRSQAQRRGARTAYPGRGRMTIEPDLYAMLENQIRRIHCCYDE